MEISEVFPSLSLPKKNEKEKKKKEKKKKGRKRKEKNEERMIIIIIIQNKSKHFFKAFNGRLQRILKLNRNYLLRFTIEICIEHKKLSRGILTVFKLKLIFIFLNNFIFLVVCTNTYNREAISESPIQNLDTN